MQNPGLLKKEKHVILESNYQMPIEDAFDYSIEIIMKDKNGKKLRFGSDEYNKSLDILKAHLDALRINVHDNFKFFRTADITILIFVGVTSESLTKIRGHIHKLNCHNEKMTVIFDDVALRIIQK